MFATVCSPFHVPLLLCNHFSLRLKLIVASRQNRWWKSWCVAPTTAWETLTQSHFLWTGWESHNFIYSLYPLNLFAQSPGIREGSPVRHSQGHHRQTNTLSQSYSHCGSYLMMFGVWEGNRASWGNPYSSLGIKQSEAVYGTMTPLWVNVKLINKTLNEWF